MREDLKMARKRRAYNKLSAAALVRMVVLALYSPLEPEREEIGVPYPA